MLNLIIFSSYQMNIHVLHSIFLNLSRDFTKYSRKK